MAQKSLEMEPIYLINGEDELKQQTALNRLIARFGSVCDLDFNKETFAGDTAVGSDIVAACNTLPFASDYRLVIVKDVDKLSRDQMSALVDYIKAPCESTVLALVALKLAKNSVLYKAVQKGFPKSIIDCTPKKRRELPGLVRSMAKVHGIQITEDAAEALISYVGESTVRLDTELKKIATALGAGGLVGTEDVRRLVSRTAEVKPWEFSDALAARDVLECERILSHMQGQSSFGLLALSLSRIRDLIATKSLERRGEIGSLASTLGRPEWQVRNYRLWASRYTSAELRTALVSGADTEKAMKSGADPDLVFERWILSIVSRGAK